jgi:hypothetical protein
MHPDISCLADGRENPRLGKRSFSPEDAEASYQILGPIVHAPQAVSSSDQILKKNNRTEEQSQTEKASQGIIFAPLSDSVPLYA